MTTTIFETTQNIKINSRFLRRVWLCPELSLLFTKHERRWWVIDYRSTGKIELIPTGKKKDVIVLNARLTNKELTDKERFKDAQALRGDFLPVEKTKPEQFQLFDGGNV